MCQKYKPKLKFSDYITSEYHNRTSAYMTTNDCDILLEKLKDGWSYVPIKNGFWLRCPDISVVDIADPFKVKKNNSIEYFALFNYIRDLKERNLLYKKIDNIKK
ncbi:hypothetical protein SDC9_93110 [bioreactor metagenome]|uniref:Uncharacterized protein n=1 Tax=bioreactor metagenome TaxID=1076179 RepID=A0A644ZZK9_9ZZZZ